MSIERVREIANAVLYEGYLLYPYRHSAIKNRQRWTFGVLYPQEYSETNGGIEPWKMRTECLIAGHAGTSLDLYIRFLHLLQRTAEPDSLSDLWPPETWDEGVEREVSVLNLVPGDLVAHPRLIPINFPGGRIAEQPIGTATTTVAREQQTLTGAIKLTAEQVDSGYYKLAVLIENHTSLSGVEVKRRDAVLLASFVSTHTILQARQGTFISSLDPPETMRSLSQRCQNIGTWPVLVGNEGEYDTMLSSPIILYDYPQIAPESIGSLFDGTEIDEILTLRIMTLTEEEKQEIRQGDELARRLLERTESLSPAQLMQLHGTIRSLKPVSEGEFISARLSEARHCSSPLHRGSIDGDDLPPAAVLIAGREVKTGSKVRLRPEARADAFDMLLKGKIARVEAILKDFEDRVYLVVTLDDDPGREQWDERVLPGHRFFFFPEEVELLEDAS